MQRVIWFAIFLVVLVVAAWNGLWYLGYFHEGDARAHPAAVAAVTESGIALSPDEQKTMSERMKKVAVEPALALGPTYKNDTYRFSVQIPEDFKVQVLPEDENGGHAIVLQNATGDGVQIYITPDKSGASSLGADDVRLALPDMRVVDAQDVELGNEKGVAFMSDNDAFGGASREVWFYFKGNLYQISTYARLDPLLKAMFGTWKFF